MTSNHPVSSIQFSSVQTPFTVTAGPLPPTNPVSATTLPISSSLPPRFDPMATTTSIPLPNAAQGRQPDKLLDTAPQTHPHSLGTFPGTHMHTVMNPMGLSPASLQSNSTDLRSQALPFPTQVAPPSRQDLNHGMSMAIHSMNPATQLGGIQEADHQHCYATPCDATDSLALDEHPCPPRARQGTSPPPYPPRHVSIRSLWRHGWHAGAALTAGRELGCCWDGEGEHSVAVPAPCPGVWLPCLCPTFHIITATLWSVQTISLGDLYYIMTLFIFHWSAYFIYVCCMCTGSNQLVFTDFIPYTY